MRREGVTWTCLNAGLNYIIHPKVTRIDHLFDQLIVVDRTLTLQGFKLKRQPATLKAYSFFQLFLVASTITIP